MMDDDIPQETQNLGDALQAMVDHAAEVLTWGAKLGVKPTGPHTNTDDGSGGNGPPPPPPPGG